MTAWKPSAQAGSDSRTFSRSIPPDLVGSSIIPPVAPVLTVDPGRRQAFADDGYVLLRRVVDASVVARVRDEATVLAIRRHFEPVPRRSRVDPVDSPVQARNLWQYADGLRTLTCSRRLAETAGLLLETSAVQLYSDVVTVGEPRATEAPWHFDGAYLPLDAAGVVVAWIPLQASGPESRGLRLRPGTHRFDGNGSLRPERPESLRRFRRALKHAGFAIVCPDAQPGDVVFYSGLTSHAVAPNFTSRVQTALWITYVRADAPMIRPRNDCQNCERELYLNSLTVGRPLHTPLHPLLWRQ